MLLAVRTIIRLLTLDGMRDPISPGDEDVVLVTPSAIDCRMDEAVGGDDIFA